jgi:hypothetical protein
MFEVALFVIGGSAIGTAIAFLMGAWLKSELCLKFEGAQLRPTCAACDSGSDMPAAPLPRWHSA